MEMEGRRGMRTLFLLFLLLYGVHLGVYCRFGKKAEQLDRWHLGGGGRNVGGDICVTVTFMECHLHRTDGRQCRVCLKSVVEVV